MIPFNEALKLVLKNSTPIGEQKIRLKDSAGFVLAEDIKAKFNIPLFDNSAVDGFGIRVADIKEASEDAPVKLDLIGTIRAGDSSKLKIKPGKAVKILTGAMIPDSVEAVVMKEVCFEESNKVYIKKSAVQWENIRREGEEFSIGKNVIPCGKQITPPVIGLLASLGYNSFHVYKKPKVSIIVTGNELIKPGEKLTKGKIYESNSYSLIACLKEIGIENISLLFAKDEKRIITKQIKKALSSSDVIITVGGVSVGDYDFVKEVLSKIGVKTCFTKVAIKPAKPNYFGTYIKKNKKKIVFGLPGNPVSSLISFNQLVKPALLKLMGQVNIFSFQTEAQLGSDIKKKTNRLEFVRGIVEKKNGNLFVEPTKGQGSHMLGGFAEANCLIHFPKELDLIHKGENVNIELISWN